MDIMHIFYKEIQFMYQLNKERAFVIQIANVVSQFIDKVRQIFYMKVFLVSTAYVCIYQL